MCLIINEDEEAIKLKSEKWQYLIGVYELVDIIENLKQQKVNYTLEEVLSAFKFYYENDAFIEL